MRRRTLLATATALALLPAAAAQAGSIAYVKDGDLWLAYPDGTSQRKVTSGGGYTSVAQADDGTLIALHGKRIRKVSAAGAILSDIQSVALDHPNWGLPRDIDASPDGTKVTYTWNYQHRADTTPCPLVQYQCDGRLWGEGGIVAWSDRATGLDELGYMKNDLEASWVDDGKVVARDDIARVATWANVPHARDEGAEYWFSGGRGIDLFDPTATRNGSMIAFTGAPDSSGTPPKEAILIYRTTGGIPGSTAKPADCFGLTGPTGQFTDPSFAPDGSQLVWEEGDGIWSTKVNADCSLTGLTPKLLIPGGRGPDFGAGNSPPPPPPPPPRPPVEVVPVPQAPTVTAPARVPTLRSFAKQPTLALPVSCDGSCRVTLTASLPKALAKKLKLKSVKLGSVTSSGSGRLTLKLKLPRKLAAKLAKQKQVALTVTGSARDASGKTTPLRLTVTLRR